MISSPPDTGARPAPGPERTTDLAPWTEVHVLLLAVATVAGAAASWPPARSPIVLASAVLLAAVGLTARLKPLVVGAAFLVATHAGSSAVAGYRPLPPGPLEGTVTVVGDPRPVGSGWRIVVRLSTGDRVEATAFGRAGAVLERSSVGDGLAVTGRLTAVGDRPWLRARHITGRASLDRVTPRSGAGAAHAVPDFVRRRIAAGAATMSDRHRALYLGLVIGDDRFQPLGQRLRFRASGLSHLLAVSGQNVAFVLVVARPFLQSLGYRSRFGATATILVVFAVVTRLEPSVLRAVGAALIAAWATATGRERSGVKILALAVTALVCVDPFLVHSIGFRLSVAASAGILVLGPAIERRLPGPSWLTAPLATTLAAQAAVAPLLVIHFGPVSLASIPANLLAGWAAAAVMTIGLTVGVVAGLSPPPVAAWLQWPAEALLWWIESVAALSARAPAPRLGVALWLALPALAFAIRLVGSRSVRSALIVGVGLLLVGTVPRAPITPGDCGPGMRWYPGGPDRLSVLVVGSGATDSSIGSCFDAGIRSVDVVVMQRGSARAARLVTGLGEVVSLGFVAAPPQHRVVGGTRQLEAVEIPTGAGSLAVTPSADGTELEVVLVRP